MIGQTISHYRIVGKLGVGDMGVLYDAQDQKLARRVALKFLSEELAGDADATRRLRREAQTIALLNHPHFCISMKSMSTRAERSSRWNGSTG